MKSDVKLPHDPQKRPICPKTTVYDPRFKPPSRFRRKKTFVGPITGKYNNNYTKMPKDF